VVYIAYTPVLSKYIYILTCGLLTISLVVSQPCQDTEDYHEDYFDLS